MKIAISSKGQVTIPKPVRRRLGLTAGTQLVFRDVGGKLIGEKVRAADPIDDLRGLIRSRQSSDRLLAAVRGEVRR